MKYWISTSGGIASAISAIIAHEKGLDFEMIFADTKIEDNDLYRFIFDVSLKLQKPLIWLCDGRNPWEVFVDERFIGNSRIAPCSKKLKTDVIRKYLAQHASPGDQLVLGMDYSEFDRIERAEINWSPRKVTSLLIELKCPRPTWKTRLEIYDIKPPKLYEFGFPHNNCGGMCVRAGLKQFATLLERLPERFAWHEKEQEKAMHAIGPTAKPFLKHTVKGITYYLTMKEFREKYEANLLNIDPFDYGGCGCFTDKP